MDKCESEELNIILERSKKLRKYYWAAAVLFWVGTGMTMKYYISQTGTEPSWIPGILMFTGAGLYFLTRHLTE